MRDHQKGFSLVEILVAVGMGMISMVVIMQVFSIFEGGKRTTTSGADAQTNGALALYLIERDTRMGGWGMDANTHASCTNMHSYCDGSAACGGAEGPISGLQVASVEIADGGNGPDTIAAQYYANPSVDTFKYPGKTTLRDDKPVTSAELDVETVASCKENDLALISQAGNCTLVQITHVQPSALKLQHHPSEYNPPGSYITKMNWPAYTKGASVSCFTPPSTGAVYQRGYAIDTATKQLQRTGSDPGDVVAPDIVDLQIQYGVAPSGSQVVNDWVDATGPTWETPTPANRRRIKAVRIALVARSAQYEKPESGNACTLTTEDTVKKWPAYTWAKFNPSTYSNDWQCYRYKVFETVVPLRNIMWGNL